MFIKNISINAANKVEITWLWNSDAEIKTVNIEGRYEGDDVLNMESFQPERYYRILVRTEIDGTTCTFDDANVFKVVRNA